MADENTGWGIDSKPDATTFLRTLDPDVQEEVFQKLRDTAEQFNHNAGRGLHLCVNGLYPLEKYNGDDGKMHMKFHVDNQDLKIRLTGFELDKTES